MITAITNSTSQNISGTTYYSDGCLYTTSYNSRVVTTVPWVSTETGIGTFWTSSSKTQTRNTYLGAMTLYVPWHTVSREDTIQYRPAYLSKTATVTMDVKQTYTEYSLSTETHSIPASGGAAYNTKITGTSGILYTGGSIYTAATWVKTDEYAEDYINSVRKTGYFCFYSTDSIQGGTTQLTNLNKWWMDSATATITNVRFHAEHGTHTYDITFMNATDYSSYTSGVGEYGARTGNTFYGADNEKYASFSYIKEYNTSSNTYTVKDAYTASGNVTKNYYLSSSNITLYPRSTYTISSNFKGYDVSTSNRMLIDTFTQTLTANATFPSEVSGLSVQYYITGTCSTEMNFYSDKARDRRYTTTNYFSVNNQRDKSYLISMAIRDYAYNSEGGNLVMEDETVYVIPPYYESYVREQTNTVTMNVQGADGVEQKSVTTAYVTGDYWQQVGTQERNKPEYGISIYEVEGWNTTSWKPSLGITAIKSLGAGISSVDFHDTISGVTLGSQVFSTTATPRNDYKRKTDYIDWGFGAKESWINQSVTFDNISNTYVDIHTVELSFNGYGTMKCDFSYSVTTTYNGLATHFVTGE